MCCASEGRPQGRLPIFFCSRNWPTRRQTKPSSAPIWNSVTRWIFTLPVIAGEMMITDRQSRVVTPNTAGDGCYVTRGNRLGVDTLPFPAQARTLWPSSACSRHSTGALPLRSRTRSSRVAITAIDRNVGSGSAASACGGQGLPSSTIRARIDLQRDYAGLPHIIRSSSIPVATASPQRPSTDLNRGEAGAYQRMPSLSALRVVST